MQTQKRLRTPTEAQKQALFIAIFALIGYFLAMLIRKYWEEGKDKVTFGGVVGTALSQNSKYRSLFAGIAVYELGHNAGLTLLPTKPEVVVDKNMGKIKQPEKSFSVAYKDKYFKCKVSAWTPVYAKDDNGRWKPNFHDLFTNSPYKEVGVYMIRTRSGKLVYVGVVRDSKDGLHRLLRHFANSEYMYPLNHQTYSKTSGYEFCVVQCNNPTPARLLVLEEYFNYLYKPEDSFSDSAQTIIDLVERDPWDYPQYADELEATNEEPPF